MGSVSQERQMGGSLPWGRVEQILSRQAASTPTARVGWSQSICPCPRAGQEWRGSLGGTATTQAGHPSRTHRWVVNSGGLRAVGEPRRQGLGRRGRQSRKEGCVTSGTCSETGSGPSCIPTNAYPEPPPSGSHLTCGAATAPAGR